MKTLILVFLIEAFTVFFATYTFAHEEHHKPHKTDTLKQSAPMTADSMGTSSETVLYAEQTGFSTLHPLVVHFPIVLLIVAALLQIIGLFYSKANWDYITLFLLASGVLAAYLAGSSFHPHTEGLPSHAAEILERHELFALLTLYASVAALILKVTGMFIVKSRKRMIEIITAFILLFSAVSVSLAGHWGAYLTHVEGVGPQGKFIETE
jgi:uncharacterized membrane protein